MFLYTNFVLLPLQIILYLLIHKPTTQIHFASVIFEFILHRNMICYCFCCLATAPYPRLLLCSAWKQQHDRRYYTFSHIFLIHSLPICTFHTHIEPYLSVAHMKYMTSRAVGGTHTRVSANYFFFFHKYVHDQRVCSSYEICGKQSC